MRCSDNVAAACARSGSLLASSPPNKLLKKLIWRSDQRRPASGDVVWNPRGSIVGHYNPPLRSDPQSPVAQEKKKTTIAIYDCISLWDWAVRLCKFHPVDQYRNNSNIHT